MHRFCKQWNLPVPSINIQQLSSSFVIAMGLEESYPFAFEPWPQLRPTTQSGLVTHYICSCNTMLDDMIHKLQHMIIHWCPLKVESVMLACYAYVTLKAVYQILSHAIFIIFQIINMITLLVQEGENPKYSNVLLLACTCCRLSLYSARELPTKPLI